MLGTIQCLLGGPWVHSSSGCWGLARRALHVPALAMEREHPPPHPHPRPGLCTDALCFRSRHSGRLLSQIVQNLALRQSQLLTVFSLCEQQVSVNYPKSIYSIPFEQFGVTGLSMHWTVAIAWEKIGGCLN